MSEPKQTFLEVLEDLDAGVFLQKVQAACAEAALGTVHTGKKGKVILTFDFSRIGDANQVECKHALRYIKPTHKGRVTEEDATSTPLHVGARGALSLYPMTQPRLPLGEPNPA